jgi:putative MATE family efflux protein
MLKRFIGDKKFYRSVFAIAVPIMLQNGITTFVGLLDNIMVGQLGTEPMSGVAIANQLIFVFNLFLFGALSGAGIFTAQFFGRDDVEGMRHTFRYKWIITTIILVLAFLVLGLFKEPLIWSFLNGDNSVGNLEMAAEFGQQYLLIMFVGLVPYAISQIYASTLRETGQTLVPMLASASAVITNAILNYILIFGKLGMPALGVAGAAIATVIARFVECGFVAVWTHKNSSINRFIIGAYKTFKIPGYILKTITIKGTPLAINEFLWSIGISILAQCYSTRGMDAVAGYNIASTITNLFNIVFMALGASVGIIVGRLLGAGKLEEARETDVKLIFTSVVACFFMGTIMFLVAPLIPEIYNTSVATKEIAKDMMKISAIYMPVHAYLHASYFTLRSGGKTFVTFLFDSAFVMCICVPVALIISRLTDIPIIPLYTICVSLDLIKCVVGTVMLKKGIWLHNIVEEFDSSVAAE